MAKLDFSTHEEARSVVARLRSQGIEAHALCIPVNGKYLVLAQHLRMCYQNILQQQSGAYTSVSEALHSTA